MEKPLELLVSIVQLEKSPVLTIKYGATETYFWTKEIFVAVGNLVTGQFSIDVFSRTCRDL